MIKTFYHLTKPGIVRGNALTMTAGFFLAVHTLHIAIDWVLLAATLISLSAIVSSACVFNNYIDRDIDLKMERTRNRALARKLITTRAALTFATILLALGVLAGLATNYLSLTIALVGFAIYVFAYTPLKRLSFYSTHVGALAGAVPPVVGYTAVTHSVDIAAVLLFIILVLWQMPHFFAIAIYRGQDYTAAGLPVLPSRKGILRAKLEMALYVLLFTLTTLLLARYGVVGSYYIAAMSVVGLLWLALSLYGFAQPRSKDTSWARKMFFFSLIANLVFCLLLIIG